MTGGASGPTGRSNSLRGGAPSYLHSEREEQLYKLVSDLSDACRQDNNANALRDLNLIENLEKNAKDIYSHRTSQDTKKNTLDLMQKRRRMSAERNASSDDEGTRHYRTDRNERSKPNTTTPTRYNMPTFFGRSNLSMPAKAAGEVKFGKASSNEETKRRGFAADDDEHIPDYASRETTINARDALCSMDALSMDELNMLGRANEFGDDKKTNDDDIESIMNHAKGSVLNQYGQQDFAYGAYSKPATKDISRQVKPNYFAEPSSDANKRGRQTSHNEKSSNSTSSQSMYGRPRPQTFLGTTSTKQNDDAWNEGGEYVYTHLGSKVFGKATKDKLISVSSSSSSLGPRAKPAFIEKKAPESGFTSPQAKVSLAGRLNDSFISTDNSDGYLPLQSYQYQSPASAATPKKDVKKEIDSALLDALEKEKNALAQKIATVESESRARTEKLEADYRSKIQALEKQVGAKDTLIQSLQSDLSHIDDQWKAQFEASQLALEVSVKELENEKIKLANKLSMYEPKRPENVNSFSQRIIWHLKEIIREDEADTTANTESEEARAKANRVAALVNRFEKSNAQVQANFAQQLRHDIKTIGIRAFEDHPENHASKAKLQETIAELQKQFTEQARAYECLQEEAKSQQSQLEMALQTAMDRDADVMDLERQVTLLKQTNESTANSEHEATLKALQDKSSELADTQVTVAQLEGEVRALQEQVTELTASLQSRDKELAAARASLVAATSQAADADHVAELTQALDIASKTNAAQATQMRATSQQYQEEISALKVQIIQLSKANEAKAKDAKAAISDEQVAMFEAKIAAQEAEIATLKSSLEETHKQLEDALAPTVNPTPDESVKKVRFEDDVIRSSDVNSVVHLQHILKKRDEELVDLKSELYERACDVNALRQEVIAKTDTIENLSRKLAQRMESSKSVSPLQSTTQLVPANPQAMQQATQLLLSNPDMAKLEMFLFNSLCNKQQEVDDLLLELDRREEAVRAVCAAETEALHQEIKVLEERYTEVSGALKLANEQQAHLQNEVEMQGKSIDNKQKQIKSFISLMAEKEAELAELDEALAIAEMQVEHLKNQYNVTFTIEQEEAFANAYEEGGRMSSFSMKAGRESFAERGKFYERMSLQMDDKDFEIEDLGPFRSRANSTNSLLSDKASSSTTTAATPATTSLLASAASSLAKPFEDDLEYAGSPRFSALSYGSARESYGSVRDSSITAMAEMEGTIPNTPPTVSTARSVYDRRTNSPPATPPVRSSTANPLQMVIQRLQGECEILRTEKREVERKLSQEQQKNAKILMEGNELQRRWLVENQKLQSECTHLKEKIRESLGTIEILTERIARTEHTERQTNERCSTLSDIIKDLEAEADRSRRTIFHFEQEMERMKDLLNHATMERDTLIERTEADAKRVRQLWEETLAQHAAQIASVEGKVAKSKRENARLAKKLLEKSNQIKEYDSKLIQATAITTKDKQHIATLESDVKSTKLELKHTQEQNIKLSESIQAMAEQVETKAAHIQSVESKLQKAVEESQTLQRQLQEKENDYEDMLGELDALRSELVECLNQHETTVFELQTQMTELTERYKQALGELEAEKKYTASISTMLGGHIGDYNKVLTSVNYKLADMRQRMEESPQDNPKPIHTPRTSTEDNSMSIFAH